MIDYRLEPSTSEDAPLRLGEILAASTMMPEVAGLPFELWLGYRHRGPQNNGGRSEGSGFFHRAFKRVLLMFVKLRRRSGRLSQAADWSEELIQSCNIPQNK